MGSRMNRLFKGLEVIRGTLENPEEDGFFQLQRGVIVASTGRDPTDEEKQKLLEIGWHYAHNPDYPRLWEMFD